MLPWVPSATAGAERVRSCHATGQGGLAALWRVRALWTAQRRRVERHAGSCRDVPPVLLQRDPMSAFQVQPESLRERVLTAVVAGELLSGAARALRRHAVDTGRSDSGDAVGLLLRGLTDEADVLADSAASAARAVRAAAGVYTATERRAMEN